MNKNSILMVSLCVGIAVMAIAYAAFSTTLNITATSSQIGTFSMQVLAEASSKTGTAGVSGGTAPTATCGSTSGATTVTMTAKLYQPGDSVTCSYKVKNTGNLKARAKENSDISCTVGNGMTTSASSSASTPMWYSATWKKTSLAAGITSGTGEVTITINYSTKITNQPSKTTGTVSCSLPYEQDIS